MKNVLGKPPNGTGDERKCLNKNCQHKSSPSLPIISGWGDILQEQLLSSVWRLAGKSLELQPGFRKKKGFPSCIFSHRKYGENAHWEYIRSSYGIMSEVTSPIWLLLIKTNIKPSAPPHPSPSNPFYIHSDALQAGLSYWLTPLLTPSHGELMAHGCFQSPQAFGLLCINFLFAVNT